MTGDVWVVATFDHGATWGDPVRVDPDDSYHFNDRPWLALGRDGTHHATWTRCIGGEMRYAAWTDARDGYSAIYLSTSPVAGP
jgi:hypothetical protein